MTEVDTDGAGVRGGGAAATAIGVLGVLGGLAAVAASLGQIIASNSAAGQNPDPGGAPELNALVLILALAATASMVALAVRGRVWPRRTSLLVVGCAIAVFALWGMLIDAATHGWDDLRLFSAAAGTLDPSLARQD